MLLLVIVVMMMVPIMTMMTAATIATRFAVDRRTAFVAVVRTCSTATGCHVKLFGSILAPHAFQEKKQRDFSDMSDTSMRRVRDFFLPKMRCFTTCGEQIFSPPVFR